MCRRRRTIVFASQHRLDLRLLCTPKTSIKQTLDLWPAFPIIVRSAFYALDDWDNIIAALQQRDRVCEIDPILQGPQSKIAYQIMQEPFPLLDRLKLWVWDSKDLASSTLLGGSAHRLRVLHLDVFPSPAFDLPRILSSAGQLIDLQLKRVPSTGCISPGALVAALSAAARLKTLYLQFLRATSPSNPRSILPPSSGSFISSTLLCFTFLGPCNYLEDLLSRISVPPLECTRIIFFEQPKPNFDVSQLFHFLGRVEPQSLPDRAKVSVHGRHIYFSLTRSVALPVGRPGRSEWLWFELPFRLRLELSLMTQICQQISLSLQRANP